MKYLHSPSLGSECTDIDDINDRQIKYFSRKYKQYELLIFHFFLNTLGKSINMIFDNLILFTKQCYKIKYI